MYNNKTIFNRLANRTAVHIKLSPTEVAVIKSIVQTKKSKYSDISGKQEVNKANTYQKKIKGNSFIRFRRNG